VATEQQKKNISTRNKKRAINFANKRLDQQKKFMSVRKGETKVKPDTEYMDAPKYNQNKVNTVTNLELVAKQNSITVKPGNLNKGAKVYKGAPTYKTKRPSTQSVPGKRGMTHKLENKAGVDYPKYKSKPANPTKKTSNSSSNSVTTKIQMGRDTHKAAQGLLKRYTRRPK
tara:strand:+ start:43 stop:555 length:513 start_codon:yes stop_codon:yes gene_type:complete